MPLQLIGPEGRWVVTGERNRPGYRCKSPRELKPKRLKTEDIDKPRQDAREELGDLGHPPKQYSRQIPQDCIVLTTQESDFQCGGLTVRQLKKRLEQFWDPPFLFPTREYRGTFHKVKSAVGQAFTHRRRGGLKAQEALVDQWLLFFIRKNVTFGVVNAWVASLKVFKRAIRVQYDPQDFDDNMLQVRGKLDSAQEWKFKKDGLSILPEVREAHKREFINWHGKKPRRVWDVANNKIIPGVWLEYGGKGSSTVDIWPISHAWVGVSERVTVQTSINGFEWPVPIPKDVTLEGLRDQLLAMGCRYAWLDVLCLRQKDPRPEKTILQLEEWKTDIPLIGSVFKTHDTIITYFNGLGRPFQPIGWDNERHWLKRAWTLQETKHPSYILPGGVDPRELQRPFHAQIDSNGTTLGSHLEKLSFWRENQMVTFLIAEINTRFAQNDTDRVVGIQLILGDTGFVPVYRPTDTPETAWSYFASNLCLDFQYSTDTSKNQRPVYSVIHQLMDIFPHPSSKHWFPSWSQVSSYPDVSVTEIESPDPLGEEFLSMGGRGPLIFGPENPIYKNCQLRKCDEGYVTTDGVREVLLFYGGPNQGRLKHSNRISGEQAYVIIDITPEKEEDRPPHMVGCRMLLIGRQFNVSFHDYSQLSGQVFHVRRVTTLYWRHHEARGLPFERTIRAKPRHEECPLVHVH